MIEVASIGQWHPLSSESRRMVGTLCPIYLFASVHTQRTNDARLMNEAAGSSCSEVRRLLSLSKIKLSNVCVITKRNLQKVVLSPQMNRN